MLTYVIAQYTNGQVTHFDNVIESVADLDHKLTTAFSNPEAVDVGTKAAFLRLSSVDDLHEDGTPKAGLPIQYHFINVLDLCDISFYAEWLSHSPKDVR